MVIELDLGTEECFLEDGDMQRFWKIKMGYYYFNPARIIYENGQWLIKNHAIYMLMISDFRNYSKMTIMKEIRLERPRRAVPSSRSPCHAIPSFDDLPFLPS